MADDRPRCGWASGDLLIRYHDQEWGVPVHDDTHHLELLTLEGAQAGLSWVQVLRRRDAYRRVFHSFDPVRVASMDDDQVDRAMRDPGIIRNRAKCRSAVANAEAFIRVRQEWGTFDRYIWSWVDGQPVVNRWATTDEVPALTELAERVSKDLRARGFGFVGPVIVYSYLQAAGLVMDHVVTCFRWADLTR
jgi:DNA-3-methyladenine glycosylase I